MKKVAIILFFFQSFCVAAQQTLSIDEQKIIDQVNKNLPQQIQLLKDIVNINSGTLNINGVKKVGEALQARFDEIGFTTEWISLPDSLKRAGHLVAYRKGTKGKKLFLIGHLDTVFEPEMEANPFTMLSATTATGQGVNDMKGGDVIILAALQALNELGLLDSTTITAYFTCDEEKAGEPVSISRADFIERAKIHDVGLAFETAQGFNTIATGRRGSSSWQLTVYGKQAHSAGVFSTGYGAIYEASRIINTFRVQLGNEKYLTFNPGLFVGGSDLTHNPKAITATVGSKLNIIAPLAVVQGDLRFLTEAQKEKARAKMKAIVATNNLKGTRAEISFTDGIPGMEPTTGNLQLAKQFSDVTIAMGLGPIRPGDPGSRGAGDISYVAQYLDCLDGLGAGGTGAHAPGEIIDLQNFPKYIQRAALFIYRLTRD